MATADAKEAFARAYSQGVKPCLVSVTHSGRDEIWAIGENAFVIPVVPADASPELEYALRTRRDAALTGSCDHCGATPTMRDSAQVNRTHLATALFAHRKNCPASDENAGPRLHAHWEEEDRSTVVARMRSASGPTREEVQSKIGEAGVKVTSTEGEVWFETLVKDLFGSAAMSTCADISGTPAQTWNSFIAVPASRCNSCWEGLRQRIFLDGPLLDFVEEHTCDICRKYVRSLMPLVGRMDHIVLHGELIQHI